MDDLAAELADTLTLRMQNLDVGATLDCTGAVFTRPRLRPDATLRPSIDLRAATIGKDLLCVDGFVAAGGVRVRVADMHKSAQFVDATLGTSVELTRYSLNAYGLTTTDLAILPALAPAGGVRLASARVARSPTRLWAAEGGVAIDGFDYQLIVETRGDDTRQRLALIERATHDYAPGPYEQLAAAYRRAGHEDRAERVLMARQVRRYSEAGPASRIWGWLQRGARESPTSPRRASRATTVS